MTVQLKVFSEYSYRSTVDVTRLVTECKKKGIGAVAITDIGTLHHMVDLYEEGKSQGVKPIMAVTIPVQGASFLTHVTFYAKDNKGLEEVVSLSSHYQLHAKRGILEQNEQMLKTKHTYVTINIAGWFQEKTTPADMIAELRRYQKLYGEALSLEVKTSRHSIDQKMNDAVYRLAKAAKISPVATGDVTHIDRSEESGVFCLEELKKTELVWVADRSERYLKDARDISAYYEGKTEALKRAEFIARNCTVTLGIKGEDGFENQLPSYKPENGQSAMEYFLDEIEKGFQKHYGERSEAEKEVIRAQIAHEKKIIFSKDYVDYFLIDHDLLKWARENDIPVAKGRGSVVASAISKCLGITETDPFDYDLLFERFLNEDRKDAVDIDIDFPQEYRGQAFDYLRSRYKHVAKIATFNNYGPMEAFEIAATIQKLPNNAKKIISLHLTELIKTYKMNYETGNEALRTIVENEAVKKVIAGEKLAKTVLESAYAIVGKAKHVSVHAAAVIIGKKDFGKRIPFLKPKEKGKDYIVFQLPNNTHQMEKLGYTKFDLLSLKDLDIKERTLKRIEKRIGRKLEKIPTGDEKTFECIANGETVGVFQMDSYNMRKISIEVSPKNMEEFMPIIALYRPGPKGLIPLYVKNKRKNNKTIYDVSGKAFVQAEEIEKVLSNTFGVIVYQEQILQLAKVWAGYNGREAERFRVIVSKKKAEEMENEQERFLSYSAKKGRKKEDSVRLFQLIQSFANFGFNRAHTAAYAETVYEMTYLKTHYPLEFMASLLEMQDKVKDFERYHQEVVRMGLPWYFPSVNESEANMLVTEKGIRYGLMSIRNIGVSFAQSIIEERENGMYRTFRSFVKRVRGKQGVTKNLLKIIIHAGCCDEFGERMTLLESLDEYWDKETPKKSYTIHDFKPKKDENEKPYLAVKKRQTLEKEQVGYVLTGQVGKGKRDWTEIMRSDEGFVGRFMPGTQKGTVERIGDKTAYRIKNRVIAKRVVEAIKQNESIFFTEKEGVIVSAEPLSTMKKEIVVTLEERIKETDLMKEFRLWLVTVLHEKDAIKEESLIVDTGVKKGAYAVCLSDKLLHHLERFEREGGLQFVIKVKRR